MHCGWTLLGVGCIVPHWHRLSAGLHPCLIWCCASRPFNMLVQFCAAHLSLPIPLDLPSDGITKVWGKAPLPTFTCRLDGQMDLNI